MRKPKAIGSKAKSRIKKLRFRVSDVAVMPWREAWAEAGEPWIETAWAEAGEPWVEWYWGRRDPQGGRVTDPIDPKISAIELWLRFAEGKPVRAAKRAIKKRPARAKKKK